MPRQLHVLNLLHLVGDSRRHLRWHITICVLVSEVEGTNVQFTFPMHLTLTYPAYVFMQSLYAYCSVTSVMALSNQITLVQLEVCVHDF